VTEHIAEAWTSVSVDWTPASSVVYWHTSRSHNADLSHASRTQTHRLLENYIYIDSTLERDRQTYKHQDIRVSSWWCWDHVAETTLLTGDVSVDPTLLSSGHVSSSTCCSSRGAPAAGTDDFPPCHTIPSITCTHVCIYTVNHNKRATLFLIVTPAFLGRFLYFLYQCKQEELRYKQVNKMYHFTLTVSPQYLVKLKRCTNCTF